MPVAPMSDWRTPKAVFSPTSLDFSNWLNNEVPVAERIRIHAIVARVSNAVSYPITPAVASRAVEDVKAAIGRVP